MDADAAHVSELLEERFLTAAKLGVDLRRAFEVSGETDMDLLRAIERELAEHAERTR